MDLEKIKTVVRTRFKGDKGEPLEITDGQAEIFGSIVIDDYERVVVKCVTQYGKSMMAGLALIYLASSTSKRILIIAPRTEQAKIIMGYVRDHIFDHPFFEKQIEIEGSIERFKRQRSKTALDWKSGASIKILTANVREVSKEAKNLMGWGAELVLVDESSLIPDKMYSKILRMVGGVDNGKLVQLSNPFNKNHFWKAFQSNRYYKINIDYKQALEEGRLKQAFLDEAKENMDPLDWRIFYECEFPDSAEDALIPLSKIQEAIDRSLPEGKQKELGGDVARHGGDKSVGIIRSGAKVLVIEDWQGKDTMQTAGRFRNMVNKETPMKIDVIGIGAGVVDRLDEDGYKVTGVNVASSPQDKEKFGSLRDEIFWGLRQRFMQDDIDIPMDKELIDQLSEIRYSYNSRGQLKVESKDKMKKRGLKSPDKADALALAFYNPPSEELAKIDIF